MTERRTKLEILQTIQNFFNELGFNKSFYKSDLKTKGIDPATAEDFIKIIMFCQRELPIIEVTDFGRRFILKENINQKHLDLNEFLQLKEELVNKKDHLTPVDTYTKTKLSEGMRTLTYNSDPLFTMEFKCQECTFMIKYPDHCGEPMDYNSNTNQLECSICDEIKTIPPHHGKDMKIMIKKQPEDKKLFKFISPIDEKGNS